MTDAARGQGYRLIVPNRRLYPGSTPYTPAEIATLQPDSPHEIFTHTLERQGLYLLEFVDSVVQVHGLEKVAVAGWSLGALFLTLAVGAITQVSTEVRGRLKASIQALILWGTYSVISSWIRVLRAVGAAHRPRKHVARLRDATDGRLEDAALRRAAFTRRARPHIRRMVDELFPAPCG